MLTVKDIMTEAVIVIRSSATVAQATHLMRATRIRALIVERSQPDGPYGILTEKDIVYKVIALGHDPERIHVGAIMRQPCIQLSPELSLQEAAQALSEAGIHRAPVIQQHELLGILSVTDLLMKGNIARSATDDMLDQRIREALQHARIVGDQAAQIKQECDIAWQVVEELQAEANSRV